MREAPPYRIGHGGYVSEFTRFLNDFIAKHPEVPEDQMRGWYLLWDHNDVDLAEMKRVQSDSVPFKSYE